MAAANAYPGYQPVRSRWVSRVPEHWSLLRAKNFLREIDDRTKTGEETLLSMRQHRGLVPHNDVSVKRIPPENLIGYKKARPDELVLNRMQAGNAMFFRNRLSGLVSPDYAVFRLLRDDCPEYLGYLFRSWSIRGLFRSESKGLGTGTSGFLRLYSDRFAALEIPLPTRPEQDQIVAYLRAQDAHIARLIKAKRELIKLLTEQKQRIVVSFLTGRSLHSESLKASGNLWLGHVPSSWVVCRVKAQLFINEGGCWGDDPVGNTGTPVLRSTEQAMDGSWKVNKPAIRLLSHKEAEAKSLKCGDLVMTKSSGSERHIGKTSLVNAEIEALGCCFSNFMQRLRPKPTTSSKWIWFLLNSRLGRDQMAFGSNSTTGLGNLTRDVIGNVWFAMPPKVVQDELIEQLEIELKPIDSAIAQERDQIKLILEYRDRQIADVVTGQVDVRGWVPGPDDAVADDDLAVLGDDEESDTDGEEDNDQEN